MKKGLILLAGTTILFGSLTCKLVVERNDLLAQYESLMVDAEQKIDMQDEHIADLMSESDDLRYSIACLEERNMNEREIVSIVSDMCYAFVNEYVDILVEETMEDMTDEEFIEFVDGINIKVQEENQDLMEKRDEAFQKYIDSYGKDEFYDFIDIMME